MALSGGRDSVALLHALCQVREEYCVTLCALTCEHGIRGERSKSDLAFVKQLCNSWNVPLRVFELDVPTFSRREKLGVEEGARVLRYRCFQTVLDEGQADVIVTAHHRDDCAETVLFRLLRGTSLYGLNVFPNRKGIARPLLSVTRAQIDEYVARHALEYVEDESNGDIRYTRNFLRREALPLIKSRMAGAAENLVRFAERAAEDEEYLSALAQKEIRGERVALALPMPVFSRACMLVLKRMGITKDYTAANVEEIAKLKDLQSGRHVNLPDGIEAAREGDDVVFYRPKTPEQREIPFALGECSCGEYLLLTGKDEQKNALVCDADKLPKNCVVRTRREGDFITPFGGGTKSLKKFFTDRKISARIGRLLPLICDGSEVYAVCGVEISDKIKTDERTETRIYFTLRPLG